MLSAQEPSESSKIDYGERVTKRVRFKKMIAEYEPSVKSQCRNVSQHKSTVLKLSKGGMSKRFSTDTDPGFLKDSDVTIGRLDSVNTLDHPKYTFVTETSIVTDRNVPKSGY